MNRQRYVVHGRVQGVGFRWFVSREANRLKLRGFARNLSDGSVEVVAEGTDAALLELEQMLQRGPTLARVHQVERTKVPDDVNVSSSFETM